MSMSRLKYESMLLHAFDVVEPGHYLSNHVVLNLDLKLFRLVLSFSLVSVVICDSNILVYNLFLVFFNL